MTHISRVAPSAASSNADEMSSSEAGSGLRKPRSNLSRVVWPFPLARVASTSATSGSVTVLFRRRGWSPLGLAPPDLLGQG